MGIYKTDYLYNLSSLGIWEIISSNQKVSYAFPTLFNHGVKLL